MNPPTPGLHRLFQGTAHVAKVALQIPAGDVLEVSDSVAEQLLVAGFKTEDQLDAPKGAPAVDGPEVGAEPVDDSVEPVKPAAKAKRRK